MNISLIGLHMLGKIDQRQRQAKNKVLPMGVFTVVLIGDNAQLPPVMSTLYGSAKTSDTLAVGGEVMYKLFSKIITD